MQRRVVITGLGIVSPLGIGAREHRASLLAGRSAVARLERLSRLGFPVDVAAEIGPQAVAACLPRLPRKQVKLFNRATTFAMTAAVLAAEDAGLSGPVADAVRAGVILATLFIPYPIQSVLRLLPEVEDPNRRNQADLGKALKRCMGGVNPLDLSLKIVPNLTAGHIAISYGLRGACRTVADGWTGGLSAIAQAATAIRDGMLDLAFCGGTECPLEDLVFADLCSTDLLAPPASPPDATCRPFGVGRQGLVVGEGAAVLILEAEDCAIRRGARIHAEVAGYGAACGASCPDGFRDALTRAMGAALAEGKRDAADAVSVHGNGGPETDLGEAAALRSVAVPLAYATKAAHGDLFSAAGPLAAADAVMSLEDETLPPSWNCGDNDPACRLTLTDHAPRRVEGVQSILVNALGVYGEAASLLVTRAGAAG